MDIIYSGFDTIDFSIQGALPAKLLEELAEIKSGAAKAQRPTLARLGPGEVEAHVHEAGMVGGFSFRLSTGPEGEIIAVKDNHDPKQWNLTVSIRAAALASHGWRQAVQNAWDRVEGLGCRIVSHSLRRIDYAMDVRVPVWDLRLDSFVAHARSTIRPHWGQRGVEGTDEFVPQAVTRGRRLSSVTVGKMPGRQIIVYDKRSAAIEKREFYWFDAWDLPRDTPDLEVMRVELRAGKQELKERWRITTFEDFENSIADVFEKLTDDIRYLAPGQSDSNVSRQALDPLWKLVKEHLAGDLFEMRSGLVPGQVKEWKREEARRAYEALVLGNAAGLAVTYGLTDEEAAERLPQILSENCTAAFSDSGGKIMRSLQNARERLHFTKQ